MSDQMILYQMESIGAIIIFLVQKGGDYSREGDYPLVVHRANVGPNQSEREKDNRGIVLEGHVSH